MLYIYTFIHVKMLLILVVFNRYAAAFVLCFKSANSGPDLMMFLPASQQGLLLHIWYFLSFCWNVMLHLQFICKYFYLEYINISVLYFVYCCILYTYSSVYSCILVIKVIIVLIDLAIYVSAYD